MTAVDPTKVQFSSTYIVDKIAMYSTKEDGQGYTSNGNITIPAASGLPFADVDYITIANPYGRKCLITLSWSLDGINYYPQNVPIFYFNVAHNSYYWRALSFGGCSDSTLVLGITTQYDVGPQTIYLQFALDSPS